MGHSERAKEASAANKKLASELLARARVVAKRLFSSVLHHQTPRLALCLIPPGGNENDLTIEGEIDSKMLSSDLMAAIEEMNRQSTMSNRATFPLPQTIGSILEARANALTFDQSIDWRADRARALDGTVAVAFVGVSRAETAAIPKGKVRSNTVSLGHSIQVMFARHITSNLGPTPMSKFGLEANDLLREAGRHFVSTCTSSLYDEADVGHLTNLFEDLNQIASLAYEGGELRGAFILASEDDRDLAVTARFVRPVPISNFTWARKILELSTERTAVAGTDRHLHALVNVRQSLDRFSVEFFGRRGWQLMYCDQPLMEVKHGIPSLPRPRLTDKDLSEAIREVFGAKAAMGDALVRIARIAREQSHGTLIVISSDAAAEAKRLAAQGVLIAPSILEDDAVRAATRIDGAILLDCAGYCYAVGVILDGVVTEQGDPARGARYNSALRYVTSAKGQSRMALVVSEDGHVDLLPTRLPSL